MGGLIRDAKSIAQRVEELNQVIKDLNSKLSRQEALVPPVVVDGNQTQTAVGVVSPSGLNVNGFDRPSNTTPTAASARNATSGDVTSKKGVSKTEITT
jgi:hypothetical protein